jgi:transcriptional regulator with XRE-family HTH domain
VSTDPKDRWHDLGAFIREQRASARLSLRRLSELAGISNPYLSQIERGLRRPSAEILQQIAKALRISAETLYVQAGILEPPETSPDLTRAIMVDPGISEEHKQALVRIYLSFRREYDEEHAARSTAGPPEADPSGTASVADHSSPTPRRPATPGRAATSGPRAVRVRAEPSQGDDSRDEPPGREAARPSATAPA